MSGFFKGLILVAQDQGTLDSHRQVVTNGASVSEGHLAVSSIHRMAQTQSLDIHGGLWCVLIWGCAHLSLYVVLEIVFFFFFNS